MLEEEKNNREEQGVGKEGENKMIHTVPANELTAQDTAICLVWKMRFDGSNALSLIHRIKFTCSVGGVHKLALLGRAVFSRW